jgi:hypothetical protein
MMALDMCNASVSFDIEGAREKLEELTLANYPGEEVFVFMANARQSYADRICSTNQKMVQTVDESCKNGV